MSYQQQAGWEWLQEDERRWELEQQALIETQQTSLTQQTNDRLLADFDSIFMNEGE